MEVQIIEKVFCKSMAVRLARETWYIQKFQTVSQGINKKKHGGGQGAETGGSPASTGTPPEGRFPALPPVVPIMS